MFVKANPDNTIAEFPYDSGLLRRDNPSTSFPSKLTDEIFASYGVYRVRSEPQPTHDELTQYIVRDDAPTYDGAGWVIGWTVRTRTPEQQAAYDDAVAQNQRARRNSLLSATDWHALSDVVMSPEMAAYRQSLRDITSHANWPHLEDSDWPVAP